MLLRPTPTHTNTSEYALKALAQLVERNQIKNHFSILDGSRNLSGKSMFAESDV